MPARIAPMFALFTIALSISFVSADAARAVNTAADALADKFSGAEEARLKKEAEEKAKRDAEAAVKAEAERRKAQEVEMLARARAEAAEREVALRKEAEAKRAEEERQAAEAKAAGERRIAEEARTAEEAETARTALSAEREREARALSEKLKRVREERPATPAPGVKSAEQEKSEIAPKSAHGEPEVRTVTVLLVMDPGTYGIRRGNKSADPVLCVDTGCYVSAGPASSAKWMAKGLALGPINTLGARAGACRNSRTCIFRNVDLGASRRLQPVDLHYLKHDRREAITARPDRSCAGADGHLSCSEVVSGKGWRAWVVPESVALSAGVSALEKAAASLAAGSVNASLRDLSNRQPLER